MTRAHLFTFKKLSAFMSKAEMHFICEGAELWTSFTSPKRLNMESSCMDDELEDVSVCMARAELCFMHEGMEPLTSFTSPRWLMELSCPGDEDLPPVLILVKTEGLGCLPPFSL